MLPAQLVNVAEAGLRDTPSPDDFIRRLQKAVESQDETSVDSALFGDTFKNVAPLPAGSEKTQKGGLRALLEFQKVLDHKKLVISDLDDYFVAFGKFVLKIQSLFDTEAERVTCKAQRMVLCNAAGVGMREWSPETLTTYINGLASLYKSTKPPAGIVPKASAQFPKFVRLCEAAGSRWKKVKARRAATRILDDDDLEKLHGATQWDSWRSVQRFNILKQKGQ